MGPDTTAIIKLLQAYEAREKNDAKGEAVRGEQATCPTFTLYQPATLRLFMRGKMTLCLNV